MELGTQRGSGVKRCSSEAEESTGCLGVEIEGR